MIDPAPLIYLGLMALFTLGLLRLRAIAIRKDRS